MRTSLSEQEDTSLVDAAYRYAEQGWPVLPLTPREKRPLTRHGLKDASTDLTQVRAWWRAWPNANVGIRTGVAFDVLDLDGDTGFESLYDFLKGADYAHTGPIGVTSKGEHWLFTVTGRGNGTHLIPNVDFRGENGYIVAPPSIHPSGRRYHWLVRDVPPAEPTEWLLQLLDRIPAPRPEPQFIFDEHPPAALKNRLPLTTRQQYIESRPDICDTANTMGLRLYHSGSGVKTHCIYHEGDREPSLVLYTHNNTFYCFGCGARGDSHDLEQRKAIER